jgi:hypothetical protein
MAYQVSTGRRHAAGSGDRREAGVGKTRLAERRAAIASGQSVRVLRAATCRSTRTACRSYHGPPQRGTCPPSLRRLRQGDVDTLRELTDPDAVWHNPGRNQLSGDHRGVDAILRFFAKTAELTGGTFRADLHDVVANDDHAVAIYNTHAEHEGRTFENRSVLVQHIRNGKLVETWLLEDRGAHALRGMAGEWQLFAVRA